MTQANIEARRAVISFVGLTFLVTWAIWSVIWLAHIPMTDLRFRIIAAPGMLIPGLAALLVTRLGLRADLASLSLRVRPAPRYLAWAVLLFPALVLITLGLSLLLGAHLDAQFHALRDALEDAHRATGKPLPTQPLWLLVVLQFVAAMITGPLINLPFTMGEELGWRGFLLPRLLDAGASRWTALVISGVIWGVWHAPIILRGYNYPGHPYLGTLLFIPACVIMGVIFGWLRLASGSVWTAALAHGALNATAPVALLVLKDYDSLWLGTVVSVVGWVPMLVFIAWLVRSGRLPLDKD